MLAIGLPCKKKQKQHTLKEKKMRNLPKASPRMITLSSIASKKKRVISQSTWEHDKHDECSAVQESTQFRLQFNAFVFFSPCTVLQCVEGAVSLPE